MICSNYPVDQSCAILKSSVPKLELVPDATLEATVTVSRPWKATPSRTGAARLRRRVGRDNQAMAEMQRGLPRSPVFYRPCTLHNGSNVIRT